MSKLKLPRFLIYQPNKNEFHICLEVNGTYLRWSSNYTPTLDVNFPREVTRIEDLPLKNTPRKQIFDEGTYAITQSKSDSKAAIEEKIAKSVGGKSFSFILKGKVLKGRFAIKRLGNDTVIQKFKDKYAKDEDVLSGDLIRTINTMVPDYDETKVKLSYSKKTKAKQVKRTEEPPVEEITANKQIGNKDYHFAFYTSDNEPELCVVSDADGKVLVLKKNGGEWVPSLPLSNSQIKHGKEFIKHATAWYELSNE